MRRIELTPDPLPPAGTRGRGATPRYRGRWQCAHTNPAGRRVLDFRFRPLSSWDCGPVPFHPSTPSHPSHPSPPSPPLHAAGKLALVLDLLCDYFEQIGGLWLANDAVVGAWYDGLTELHVTPAQVRIAINEKVRQLRPDRRCDAHAKRKFISAVKFPLDIPRLLECSEEYREEIEHASRKRARDVQTARTLDATRELESDAQRTAAKREQRQQAEAQRVGDLAASTGDRRRAHWLTLSDSDRSDVLSRRRAAGDACTAEAPSVAALNLALIVYPGPSHPSRPSHIAREAP